MLMLLVSSVVLLCVFTFWVPCCAVGYYFRIKTMFGFSPPVACRRAHVLFTLFVFACIQWCPTHIVLCFWILSSTCVPYVASFSGLSIIDCPFGIPKRFGKTVMVIKSTNIKQSEQSPITLSELTEHKNNHDMYRWKSRSWPGTDTKLWRDHTD